MTLLRQEVVDELVQLDEAANKDLLGGNKGETISSRCGRAIKRTSALNAGKWDFILLILAGIVNGMPWFGPNHCVRNIQPEFITEKDE